MIIQSIRLHPFAGIVDEKFLMGKGMNVFLGENERGKSTLYRAIRAALFIPLNLSKAGDDFKWLKKCYPVAGGNLIRVTLQFSANGKDHVLEKIWSSDPKVSNCTLRTPDNVLMGADAVQKAMSDLLLLNRASWEHMLFIPQSSIKETMQQLEKNITSMDSLQSFQTTGDRFNSDGFIGQIRNMLTDLESRWDAATRLPEGGRGINNPWRNNVGQILASWYEKEQLAADSGMILGLEQRVEKLNENITRLQGKISELDLFIQNGTPLMQDATRRAEIQAAMSELSNQAKPMKQIHEEWVQILAKLPIDEQAHAALQVECEQLLKEQQHAQARRLAGQQLKKNGNIQETISRLEDAKKRLDALSEVPDTVVATARKLEKESGDARLQLEAQKLRLKLSAEKPSTVRISIPGEPDRSMEILPGRDEELSSAGSVGIRHGDLDISVISGNVDVDQLQGTVTTHTVTLKEIYDLHGVSDLAQLQRKQSDHSLASVQLKQLEKDLALLLDGSTIESWNEEISKLQDLPSTRELDTVNAIYKVKNDSKIALDLGIKDQRKKLDAWVGTYESPDDLFDKVANMRGQWKNFDADLQKLAPLPDGYQTPTAFLQTVQERQDEKDRHAQELQDLFREKSTLLTKLEQQPWSSTELSEKLLEAEARFLHRVKEAAALRKILGLAETMQAGMTDNPFDKVGGRINELLHRLTDGKYASASFEKNLPTGILNGQVNYSTDLLSDGMLTSLAVAVRLAYAEVYLKDLEGFMMLDDPFTELDPKRRKRAAEVVTEMARDKQIIFLTCHPEHASLFPGPAMLS